MRELRRDAEAFWQTEGRQRRGYLAVPVAIHLMERHGCTRVSDYWTPDKLLAYFGEGKQIDDTSSAIKSSAVNSVWAKAGIRLDVRHVERCFYEPLPPRTNCDGRVRVPDPATMRMSSQDEQQTRIDGYLETNRLYGLPGMVNLYFWADMEVDGYGESPRRNRIDVLEQHLPALPTVWIRSTDIDYCRGAPTLRCRWLLAHEIGHALGLRHSCLDAEQRCCNETCAELRDYLHCRFVPPGPGNGAGPTCPCARPSGAATRDGLTVGRDPLEECGGRHHGARRLMFPTWEAEFAGEEIVDEEVHSARSAVREFFYRRSQ